MRKTTQIIDDVMPVQLRKALDYLYDGHYPVFEYLIQIKHYAQHRNNQVLLWLCKNQIKGKKLVEFFQNERDSDMGRSVMNGCIHIFNKIDGTNRQVREISIDESIDRYNKGK